MKRLILAAALLLAACDKDKLPDDLSRAEGTAVLEEVNLANEVEPANVALPPELVNEAEANAAEGDPLGALPDSNPSFDCLKTSNRVEKHICEVPEFGELDRRVADAYELAMESAGDEAATRLRNIGRDFLAERNRCRSDSCIRETYFRYEQSIAMIAEQAPR